MATAGRPQMPPTAWTRAPPGAETEPQPARVGSGRVGLCAGVTGMRCDPMSMRGPAGSNSIPIPGPDLRAPRTPRSLMTPCLSSVMLLHGRIFQCDLGRPSGRGIRDQDRGGEWKWRIQVPNPNPPSAAPPSRLFACPVRVSDGRGMAAGPAVSPLPIPIPKRSARL
jgi:hypothetical protein